MPDMSPQKGAADDLRALMERIVVVEPTEAASLLAGFLGRTDLEDMSDESLAELIDLLEPEISRAATALRRSLRQSPLPMTDRARAQLAALFTLYRAAQSLINLKLGLARGEGGPAEGSDVANAHKQRVEWAARLILDCYQLYVSVPQPLFADLHQFARAAYRELDGGHGVGWQGVRDIYVAILLLAMVNPYALTVEEMEVLYPCLREISGEVEVVSERPEGSARFIDMTGRLAPHIAVRGGKPAVDEAVYVGVDALYRAETAQALGVECRVALRGFLRRLQFFLTSREPRQHQDHGATLGEHSLITIGFHGVHHRLLDEMLYSLRASQHLTFSGLDWEGLERPVHGQVKQGPSIHDFKLELGNGAKDDIDWEAMPDAEHKRVDPRRVNGPATWDVVNLSERGLRLHWRLADNSRAAVDELLLIERDPDEEVGGLDAVVGLGIIRWVRHLDAANRTIDMGVERLEGDWMAYFAHPSNASLQRTGTWPVLARLAGERIDRLILPPDLANRDERVTVIREQGNDIELKLERIVMVGSHLVVMEASNA